MMRHDANKVVAATIASALLLLESFLVLSLGMFMMALGFTHDKDWMPFLSVIAFAFAGAASLFALSRGIKRERRWANSPAILANLIALGVAKYQFEAGIYWMAFALSATAITVIVALLILVKDTTNRRDSEKQQ